MNQKKTITLIVFLQVLVIISIVRYKQVHRLISPVPTTLANRLMVVYAKEDDSPEAYIHQVFQEHAEKALRLLRCENRSMNVKAVHVNNDARKSKDVGLFQINEYWQGVQPKFLLNYKVNTQIAWQLYKENGYSFKLWSCKI
jgi:hypothetical protein